MTAAAYARRALCAAAGLLLIGTATLMPAAPAQAETSAPWFHLSSVSRPGHLPPEGAGFVVATVLNVGDATADGAGSTVKIADALPSGLSAVSAKANTKSTLSPPRAPVTCAISSPHLVECSYGDKLSRFQQIELVIRVTVAEDAASGEENRVTVFGGGAPTAYVEHPITVSESPTPFGVEDYELSPEEAGGAADNHAGSHPFQLTTTFNLNQVLSEAPISPGEAEPAGLAKDLSFNLPAGLIGNPLATARCTLPQFNALIDNGFENECPVNSIVGVAVVTYNIGGPSLGGMQTATTPVFNLLPAAGEPARFGFQPPGAPVILDTTLRSANGEDYGVTVHVRNIPQSVGFLSNTVTFWGVPGDRLHDGVRGGDCLAEAAEDPSSHLPCEPLEAVHPPPLLSLPTSCSGGPLETSVFADSWADPATAVAPMPNPSQPMPVMNGCGLLPFAPAIGAEPTSNAATSPTGLAFELSFADEGQHNAGGVVESQTKKAVVTLPKGFTTNPSVAAGLKACSQAEYESATDQAGTGCLDESKIGDVEIESPLVEPKVLGGLYVAQQEQNPNHNLLTLYLIARNPEIGVLVKQALKVTPDPVTGQLTTEVDNVPQLPFSRFHLSFRQGQRSPLITPPACGPYTVQALLYPYSQPASPVERESSFQITQGPEGQGCPSGGLPPFHPLLEAGTKNNLAGSYSPFYARISRKDSEQEITHFSIKLPPGVVGKLAGVAQCSDAQIAAAKAREHEGGGQEELESPSCPAASEVGHTLVGTGVGNVLAYAPGKLYLAGPYHGAPISIAAITAAKVGPFDLGTVVVRQALKVNPETAEVSVDATGSDPIPHIVDGIPVHLRDVRVYVDRPEFVLNPTSCQRTSTASTVLGSGLDFVSEADDNPVTVSSPFQAADCAALGFNPKISFQLKGGTKRAQIPALKATVTARPGDANIGRAEVVLPSSEILEQGHIGTSCTRVQFKEDGGNGAGCPANSIYGRARAVSPILSEPLEGPVYLRSNGGERALPDLVAALHGQEINIDLVGFIDSVREKGGDGEVTSRLRTRFENVPDAPVSKFTLEMLGGKKGLLINRTNLCLRPHRAEVNLTAHSGKVDDFRPVVKTSCPKKKHGKGKGHGTGGRHH